MKYLEAGFVALVMLAVAGCSNSSSSSSTSAPATGNSATTTAQTTPPVASTPATPAAPAVSPAPQTTAAATPPAASPAPPAAAPAAGAAPAASKPTPATPVTLASADADKVKTWIASQNTKSTDVPGMLVVGATLPLEVILHPIAASATVPAIGTNQYAVVNGMFVLVNPSDYKIVYVFS
jgi:hypothetical protein